MEIKTVEIRLLGRFSVLRDGREVPASAFRGRLVRSLVRLLVTRRGSFVSRDVLTEALWPAGPPADPDMNLNVLVTRARQALGDSSLILTGPGGYSFSAGPACSVDAEVFLEQVHAGRSLLVAGAAAAAVRSLGAALDRWSGEPLAEDAYQDWAQAYRDRLSGAYLEALEAAAEAALAAGEPRRAVAWARLAVDRGALREAAHLLVARGLAASRDTAGALEVLAELRTRLAEELGLDPSAETLELETRILRGEPVELPAGKSHAGTPRYRDLAPTQVPEFGGLAFVGREVEMASILAATGQAAGAAGGPDGGPFAGPGIAIVAGASGSGKSRLLAEVTARSPVPALSVRAAPSERDEPWQVARMLVRAALALRPEAAAALPQRSAQALADVVPELSELRSITQHALDVESRRALALEGAIRVFEAATSGGGLVVVDDLQWTDASSLALLERVAGRLAGVGLVLAYRPEALAAGGPVASFLSGVPGLSRRVVRVEPRPLTAAALAAAIADPDLVGCLAQETDASPIAVIEVIRELAAVGALRPGADGRWEAASREILPLATEAARRGQRTAIEGRVDRHPPPRRELLALLALVGREVPTRLLAVATGWGHAEVLDALESLATSQLVRVGGEGWATAHDLIGEVVAARLGAPGRARLHELLGHALQDEGADPSEVGRHLAGAGDTAAAAEAFALAARQRLAGFAHREAQEVAEAGLALQPGPRVRAGLLEVRAEARARTGDLPGAREDLRGALATLPPGSADPKGGALRGPERSHLLARMAMLASGAEDLLRAAELAELALAEAGRDAGARAEALSVAAIIDMNADRQELAHQRSEEALELFRRLGNARGIADVLDGRAMAAFLAGNIRESVAAFDRVARLFADSGDLLRVGTPRSTRGHALTFMDRPAEGLHDAEEALELARTLGHREGEAYALWHCSEALSTLGRPAEALDRAHAALAISEEIGHREWTAASLRAVGMARQAAGEPAEALAAFRRSLAVAEHLSLFAGWAAARIALVLLAQGDEAGADPFVALSLEEGPALCRYEARLALAELAVRRKGPEAAEIVADALRQAEAGGHMVGAKRLGELAGLLSKRLG